MVEFNPYDNDAFRDPYPTYRQLRDDVPVYRNGELNFWALARGAAALAAHNDFARFSSTGGVTIEGQEKDSPFLIVKDPPEHHWHRRIGKVLTPMRIMALEPYIRSRTGELLDPFLGEHEFDVAAEFAVRLPLDVISELLSDDEAALWFLELGFAGHETVARGIPNGCLALTEFPGEQQRLLADPLLFTSAAEEVLADGDRMVRVVSSNVRGVQHPPLVTSGGA